MNNYGNQFNQQPMPPSQQPTTQPYGFPVNGQNMQYAVPMPSKAPGEKINPISIALLAMGGAVALFSIFGLINHFSYFIESLDSYYSYELSYLSYPQVCLLLSAALIVVTLETILDPRKKGDKSGACMAMYIACLGIAGITAVFGLMGLYDAIVSMSDSLGYGGFKLFSFLSFLTDPVFVLVSCAVTILFFLPKLMQVIMRRKSMQPRPAPYGYPVQPNGQFGQYPQQYVQPQQSVQPQQPVQPQQKETISPLRSGIFHVKP